METATEIDHPANTIGLQSGIFEPAAGEPSAAERFADRVIPESGASIRLKHVQPRRNFLSRADWGRGFSLGRDAKKARREGKPFQAPCVYDEDAVKSVFGEYDPVLGKHIGKYVDSMEGVAQFKVSFRGRPTFLMSDGQQIQFLQDRPPVGGMPDPSANNVSAIFKSDKVTQAHVKLLLDGLEKNGGIVDIDKLKISGSREFKLNMKAALFVEQRQRMGNTSGLCHQWSQRLFDEHKDACKDDRLVNIDGKLTAITVDHPYARKIMHQSMLAEAISDRIMFGDLPKPLISQVYGMIGPGSRDPKNVAKRPKWEALAPLVGIDPTTVQPISNWHPGVGQPAVKQRAAQATTPNSPTGNQPKVTSRMSMSTVA